MARHQAQALTEMRQSLGWKILWAWYGKQLAALAIEKSRVDTTNKDVSSDLIARQLAYRQGFYDGSADLEPRFLDWLTVQLAAGRIPTAPTAPEVPPEAPKAGGE
jgi:hypothetical protein